MVGHPAVGPKLGARRSERKQRSGTPHVLQADFSGASRLAGQKPPMQSSARLRITSLFAFGSQTLASIIMVRAQLSRIVSNLASLLKVAPVLRTMRSSKTTGIGSWGR